MRNPRRGPGAHRFWRDVFRSEGGMTLVELLFAMAIVSALVTISVTAISRYGLHQSLKQTVTEIESELKVVQNRSVAESNPVTFGMYFPPDGTRWYVVRFDGGAADVVGDESCTVDKTSAEFSKGTQIVASDFDSAGIQPATVCAPAIPGGAIESSFVFFFPRGTATGGEMTIYQPTLDQKRTLTVTSITGRIDQT